MFGVKCTRRLDRCRVVTVFYLYNCFNDADTSTTVPPDRGQETFSIELRVRATLGTCNRNTYSMLPITNYRRAVLSDCKLAPLSNYVRYLA